MAAKTLTLRPMADRVVVKPLAQEEKTAGGVILPDTAQEKPMRAKVLAVGPGRMLDNGKIVKLEVKAGDTILFGKYSGTEVKVEGDDYVILQEREILGIFEG
ncbi:MAG: co-chaperone GroES [Armatimonadetes bacterium]|nr:co-chaperone GroES [Armatimonadota bacterium]